MRRFFISGFERLLSVLTILSVLAVAALAARIAVEAQPGDTRQYLTAAVILVGGWLAVIAVAGVSFLAIAMHDNSRRMIGLMAQGTKGARPLTATLKPERAPERIPAKARPAPLPEASHDAWDGEADFAETVAVAPAPQPVTPQPAAAKPAAAKATAPAPQPAPQPVPQPAERSVFSGRAMPRIHAEPAPEPTPAPVAQPGVTKETPDGPAPSSASPAIRAPRLIAERRFPR
ncbi:hypothetical protein PE067_05445 [Paracoccus sp. DMF-8]|uniref:hypothetical protein n=1 Tax=Paracoccus sp. DMF-8 TaxID=3019445 RepID=UPI0023E7B3CD|nr:hypothetical protein [Paracoccus sp. DMF-8]MDF3605640.1 hypothetical protein [Paracoccus sp. DMF-8]